MQEPSRTSAVCILLRLLLLVYSVNPITGEYGARDGSSGPANGGTIDAGEFRTCVDGKCVKRTMQEITSGMWFGPRLGRRRRSGERSLTHAEGDGGTEGVMGLANVLGASGDSLDGWLLLSLPADRKRQSTSSFTPRLGRELYGEESRQREESHQDGNMEAENDLELLRSPSLYSPRLGRKLAPPSSTRLAAHLQPLLQRI